MSYALAQAQARYAADASQTASPARLLTMLYDRLVVDLTIAHDAMLRGDIALTGERLGHASDIILELHSTLDTELWPQGESLAALYLWLVQELMQARLRSDAQRVATCRDLVVPLRDAWHVASGGAPPREGGTEEHRAQGGAEQGGAS
ncbi:MAG: flagellar export chaperone FliS [Kineosporiaceae bacterium]|nr:flagellar export chaperone FliS [Kineosporiaceae bacterium]